MRTKDKDLVTLRQRCCQRPSSLQASVLAAWSGDAANVPAAQAVLLERAKANDRIMRITAEHEMILANKMKESGLG